jgi:hypothetical protein
MGDLQDQAGGQHDIDEPHGDAAPSRPRRFWQLRRRPVLYVTGLPALVVAFAVGWGAAVVVNHWTATAGSTSGGPAASQAAAAADAGAAASTASGSGDDDDSYCSPTTDAATSGGSPSALEASGTKLSSGTTDGHTWSLWAAKGQSGATALENGGLVLDGREYGLCPGYPNPAELEMLDVGHHAIVYGVIGYPGRATVYLTTGTVGSFTPGHALPSPDVKVVDGVSFFIGALPKPACSYGAFELNTTSPGVSAEHNLGFGGAGEGQGYYISDNPGNNGGCVGGRIDPISFSQGVWDLSPGQFQGGDG